MRQWSVSSLVVMVAAAVVWGATVVGSVCATASGSRKDRLRAVETASEPQKKIECRLGFALNVHHFSDLNVFLSAVDEIAEMGATDVLVLTPMYQENGGSKEVGFDAERCPQPSEVEAILRHAKERGLRTTLMPIVLFRHPRSGEWRGKLKPEDGDWDGWWKSYEANLFRFVDLAAATGVDTFVVGSELNSTESMVERWRGLIAKVRGRFDGVVTYSANWDRFAGVPFWGELDFISVSAWWRLSSEESPEMTVLVAKWREIREQMLAFAREQDRPIMFSEVGYPTVPWALKDPWNYIAKAPTKADGEAQAMGLEAFFAAWDDAFGRERGFAGVNVYEWDPYRAGGEGDYGYGVRGKPGLEVAKKWFVEWRERVSK